MTAIIKHTDKKRGHVRGQPNRFINGHQARKRNHKWYTKTRSPIDGRITYSHIAIAEKAVGKRLPPKTEIHHVNGDMTDNRPENLVICEDRTYHHLLHIRAKAGAACGNPDWRHCHYCKEYEAVEKLGFGGKRYYHHACNREHVHRYNMAKS